MHSVAYITQFNANSPSEFRVKAKNVNRELDFVHDALAGAVATGKYFEVFNRVVLSVAVDMMNGFLGKKLSTDMLFHDVSVFEHISPSRFWANVSRKVNPDVAVSFYVLSVVSVFEFLFSACSVVFAFAFTVAIFLFVVKEAVWTAFHRLLFSAIFACKNVSGFGVFLNSKSRAWARAIQRIFTKLFSVFRQVGRLERKFFIACLARKVGFICPSIWPSMDSLMLVHTRATTKPSGSLSCAGDCKYFFALNACSFTYQIRILSSLVVKYLYQSGVTMSISLEV